MSFFQDDTVTTLVQRNIERVSELEEVQQKKILRAFRKVRQELNDRLLVVPEGTFTEQQLNVTMVQVSAAIAAIKRDLKGELVDSSAIMAQRGIGDMIKEINTFEKKFTGSVQPLNMAGILRASEVSSFLINKHEASLDAYSEGLRAQVSQQLFSSMITRDTQYRTVSRMKSDIGKFFLGEEWKLNRIVRTEMHGIYNYTKMKGLSQVKDDTLPDLKKTLFHPMDDRTGDDSKALAKENPIVDIDEPFVQKYKGKTFTFLMPPNRPNDRAIMVPYRRAWDGDI